MSVKIAIIGTGYVGLVTGTCFAELGHDVVCVDTNPEKIRMLEAGHMPIYEPGLEQLVIQNVRAGRLRFTTDLPPAVSDRDAIFIAVGTPSDAKRGQADLSYVHAAAIEVARSARGSIVVVTKSTVPVGTNGAILGIMQPHLAPGVTVHIASNPEFLREGAAISDFMEPDRIVVGIETPEALDVMKAIYAPLMAQDVPLVVTGVNTAEIAKYAANAFLAVKVGFINEMADLCEAVGADVEDVARSIGLDKRIGAAFLRTGPGWGGSCFPKDMRAVRATAQEANTPLRIVEAAIEANIARKPAMAERIIAQCGGTVAGKRIALLGLTFKGQTDDMRESPAIEIARALLQAGATVTAYDPSNPREAAILLPEVAMMETAVAAAYGADAMALVTDWKVFKALDFRAIAGAMRSPVLLDLRNFLDERVIMDSGFTHYQRLGRPNAQGKRSVSVDGGANAPNLRVVGGTR
jgi:UDPglucose 6-dehydrogenase